MRLVIAAVGRFGPGPERDLVRDYLKRAAKGGRSLGLGPAEVVEADSRKPGKAAEGEALLSAVDGLGGPGPLVLVACDEHAPSQSSRRFAERIGVLRDEGVRRLVFMVGGADGLSSTALERAHERLGFGAQTWPHALVRVMLAEQLYRATTILAGGPYHRD